MKEQVKRSKIINCDETEDIVFDYKPKMFPLLINKNAQNFVKGQEEEESDFELNDIAAQQAGIAEINRQKIEDRVEAEALDKLKKVEETAYRESYELGLIEGTERAFEEKKEELEARLLKFDDLVNTIGHLRTLLLVKNETQLLKMVHLIASKIAFKEIKDNPEVILNIIKTLVEEAHTEDEVILHLSFDDQIFLESLREKSKKKVEFLQNVKIEADENIESGGCILATKYGAIDATLVQRVDKIWETLESRAPKIKLQNETSDLKGQLIDIIDDPNEKKNEDDDNDNGDESA